MGETNAEWIDLEGWLNLVFLRRPFSISEAGRLVQWYVSLIAVYEAHVAEEVS